ncbi:hypothetical protein G6F68_017830 [Rhizopus microsporus]|nr:hypothetical protein G6F68_017830 [Rhizopus microsporus]
MDFSQGQVRVTTLPAHRVLWLAGQHGVQDAVGEALFRAHFELGQNLADSSVLVKAGVAGGLDAGEITQMLASDRGLAEVEAKLQEAHALGISSVPTFVIDGRWAISGAQPPEAFANALRQIAAEQGTSASPAEGDEACGPDGCKV